MKKFIRDEKLEERAFNMISSRDKEMNALGESILMGYFTCFKQFLVFKKQWLLEDVWEPQLRYGKANLFKRSKIKPGLGPVAYRLWKRAAEIEQERRAPKSFKQDDK